MWLLDNAVWKETPHDINGKTVMVPRGAVSASERRIAKECSLGYQVVRTTLKRFKDEHMINASLTQGRSLISLCNYDKYQTQGNDANAAPNAGLTQDQRKPNAQKNKVNNRTTVSNETVYTDDFTAFWDIWPNKTAKKGAFKAWKKLPIDDRRRAYAAVRSGWFDRWRQSKPDASPIHPATFLSQGRYDDEQQTLTAINGGRGRVDNSNVNGRGPNNRGGIAGLSEGTGTLRGIDIGEAVASGRLRTGFEGFE